MLSPEPGTGVCVYAHAAKLVSRLRDEDRGDVTKQPIAGYTLPVRTAAQMHAITAPMPAGTEQAGDLIFSKYGSRGLRASNPGHVAIVVQPGMLIDTPTEGIPVRLRRYLPDDTSLTFGRFPATVLRPVS